MRPFYYHYDYYYLINGFEFEVSCVHSFSFGWRTCQFRRNCIESSLGEVSTFSIRPCLELFGGNLCERKKKLECCVRLIIYNKNSKKKVFKTVKLSFILVQVLPYISEHFKLISKVEYLKVK